MHSFCSVLREVYNLFQSEFSTDCEQVLPLSIYSILVPLKLRNSCLRLLPRLPVTLSFPLSILQQSVLEGSSYARCDQSSYLLTYLLTPCSRVLLEKPTGSAASQEIPRIFGTRRFITVLTSARHLSLS